MCGEKGKTPVFLVKIQGSPPRVRGKASPSAGTGSKDRITPACAGKSLPVDRAFQRLGDHPRVCGEKGEEDNRPEEQGGSPLRVRGKGRRRGRAAPSRFRLGTPRSVPPTSAPRKTDHRSFYPCSRIPGLGHLLRLACFIQLNNCKLWHAERLQIVKPYVSLFCGVSFAT